MNERKLPTKEIKIINLTDSVFLRVTSLLGRTDTSKIEVVSDNKTVDGWTMNNSLLKTLDDANSLYRLRLNAAVSKAGFCFAA